MFNSEEEREYAIEILARAVTRLVDRAKHFSIEDCKATIDAQNTLLRVIIHCARLGVING